MATTHEDRLRELADERHGWAEASTPSVRPRHESDAAACLAGAEALRRIKAYEDAWDAYEMHRDHEAFEVLRKARLEMFALLATEVTR